jgi:hypothetical protein
MDYISLLAGVLGIGPALLLMWLTFANYTYPKVERPFFDDRKVFMMLTLGLFLGVVIATVRLMFNMGDALVAVTFAVLVQLVVLVILMLKRFAVHLDTAFYGGALGLGMGATMAFQLSYRVLHASEVDGGSGFILSFLIVAIWSFQMVFISAATATIIGIGSAKGRPWHYFIQAVLIQAAYNLLLLPLYQSTDIAADLIYITITFSLATFFSLYCYWYIHKRALPELVREALSRMKKGTKR